MKDETLVCLKPNIFSFVLSFQKTTNIEELTESLQWKLSHFSFVKHPNKLRRNKTSNSSTNKTSMTSHFSVTLTVTMDIIYITRNKITKSCHKAFYHITHTLANLIDYRKKKKRKKNQTNKSPHLYTPFQKSFYYSTRWQLRASFYIIFGSGKYERWRKTTNDDSFIIFFSYPRFNHIYGTCKNFHRK